MESLMESYRPLDLQTGEIPYAFREYNPPSNVHAEKKSHAEIKAAVLQSPRMRKVIRDVADGYGCEMKLVEQETELILEEIGHKLALPALRLTASILRGVIRKVLSGIYVNKTGLDKLSGVCQEWPVVLVPSHRSYLDFILVSYVMLEHNLPLPCIAAGLDFMNMAGVSTLLRHCGAFFLRRTFGSDQLYKATFSEYVKTLLYSRQHPMEFFVEGTRSRSGKSLHPRLGLLSMVIEPYLEGRVPDIMMVPISISYERTLEELLFVREQLGVPKPKESTSGLFKAFSLLSENYGSIYVTIGDPISVHSFCVGCGISRIPHSLIPKETSVFLPAEWQMVKELGHDIVDHLHRGMLIFPPAIVAAVLLNCTQTSLSTGDLEDWVKWLSRELLIRGATLSPLQPTDAAMAMHGLEMLEAGVKMLGLDMTLTSSEGLVQLPSARSPVSSSSSSSSGSSSSASDHTHTSGSVASRATSLPDLYKVKIEKAAFDEVARVSHAHLCLGHYRNQLLHIFLLDSLISLTLEPEIAYEAALERHHVLMSALSSEFVLPLQTSAELFEEGVDRFVKRGLVSCSSDRASLSLEACQDDDRSLNFLRGLLLPFVQCMYVVCHQLLFLKGGVQSLIAMVKHVQLLGASAVQYGLIGSYEALSLTIIKNGLASLHQAGLILQASNEYGTGHDRLVKVMDEPRLLHITTILGEVCKMKAPLTARL